MPYFYSKTTNGFYHSDINEIMPNDVVEITDALHADLLKSQSDGKHIKPDMQGMPVSVDSEPPSPDVLIISQIFNLEASVTQRRLRDAQTDEAGGTAEGRAWLKNLNAQIVALRAKIADAQ